MCRGGTPFGVSIANCFYCRRVERVSWSEVDEGSDACSADCEIAWIVHAV